MKKLIVFLVVAISFQYFLTETAISADKVQDLEDQFNHFVSKGELVDATTTAYKLGESYEIGINGASKNLSRSCHWYNQSLRVCRTFSSDDGCPAAKALKRLCN